jgi:hypothetical protein
MSLHDCPIHIMPLLRSFWAFDTNYYKHGAPLALETSLSITPKFVNATC